MDVVVARADPPTTSVSPQLEHRPRGEEGKLLSLGNIARLLEERDPKTIPAKAKEKETTAFAVKKGDLLAVRVMGEVKPGTDLFGNPIEKIKDEDLPPQFQPGPGVELDEPSGELRAGTTGYAGLHEGKPAVIAPVWVTEDLMLAAYLNLPLQPGSAIFSEADIRSVLASAGIEEGIREEEVGALAKNLEEGGSRRMLVAIASGQRPVDPTDAVPEFTFATSTQAGVERVDGSIDLKERQRFPTVAEGQVLVECGPPVDGIPGINIRGEEIEVRKPIRAELVAGEHVNLVEEGEHRKLVSDMDGGSSVQVTEPTNEDDPVQVINVSVRQIAEIAGNVDYDTGNIDFKGNVEIKGSVRGGFKVKATGDILIGQSVEDGAEIATDGSLEVKQGIVGTTTVVEVGKDVKAKFIQDAKVRAGGDVTADVYLRTARVQAKGKVIVTGRGESGGILGGETWALGGIVSNNVGAEGNQTTELSLGVLPDMMEDYQETKKELAKAKDTKQALLEAMGISILSKIEITKALQRNPRKQKEILQFAQNANEHAKTESEAMMKLKGLGEALQKSAEAARLEVSRVAYRRVKIRIGDIETTLEEEVKASRFRLEKSGRAMGITWGALSGADKKKP